MKLMDIDNDVMINGADPMAIPVGDGVIVASLAIASGNRVIEHQVVVQRPDGECLVGTLLRLEPAPRLRRVNVRFVSGDSGANRELAIRRMLELCGYGIESAVG